MTETRVNWRRWAYLDQRIPELERELAALRAEREAMSPAVDAYIAAEQAKKLRPTTPRRRAA